MAYPAILASHIVLPHLCTCAEENLPQAGLVGDMRISYAKFLELLKVRACACVLGEGLSGKGACEGPHCLG